MIRTPPNSTWYAPFYGSSTAEHVAEHVHDSEPHTVNVLGGRLYVDGEGADAIDVVYGDRGDIDVDTAPLFAQTVGGELLQQKPQTVDIPSPGFHALESEASAASFAGGLSPPPCKPAGGVTRDRSFQKNMGDRGGTCHAPCGGGGGRFFDYHHIHERPAPRTAFNRVGIG